MTIAQEVEKFLKARGTPATPKYIAEAIGRGTAGNIARALRDLTNAGKLIRTEKSIHDKPVWYEWNVNYCPMKKYAELMLRISEVVTGVPKDILNNANTRYYDIEVKKKQAMSEHIREHLGKGLAKDNTTPESKFTVGSEWRTRGGEKAVVIKPVVIESVEDGAFLATVLGQTWGYSPDGRWIGSRREYDLIAPWSEQKPSYSDFLKPYSKEIAEKNEPKPYKNVIADGVSNMWVNPEKSELRRILKDVDCSKFPPRVLLETIITEIEKLQKPVEKPVDESILWVNVYNRGKPEYASSKEDADIFADNDPRERIARLKVPYRKGQFDE